jgi:hypothetical protein
VLELTGVEEQLVLVDDPDDLVPPPSPTHAAPPRLEAAPFDITLTRASGRATLTLVGELDMATTPRLKKYLTTLARTHKGLVVIDLRQLTFLDAGMTRSSVIVWSPRGSRPRLMVSAGVTHSTSGSSAGSTSTSVMTPR